MPQPPLDIVKYLGTPLIPLREQYPPGTGGTGPRADWAEGTLKGVEVIQDFEDKVNEYLKTVPTEPVRPHPAHKYPKFVQARANLPSVLKSPADLQKCLSTLPLAAISSVLTALDADPEDLEKAAPATHDKAGYESPVDEGKTKAWFWHFSKSPMGSGEFLLMRQGSNEVKMVVRTINSSAFTPPDWDEYVATGPYTYNTKSKASWYWSRSWGATKRLGCHGWVLTDWQRWVFGCFDEGRTHGWVSPIMRFDARSPSIGQAMLYWAKSAMHDPNGFKPSPKDTASMPRIFPDNPARRVSVSGAKPRTPTGVKAANESDIEESDVEDAS
ncbi:hypothetical protein JCM24511_00535 [Saitozyma sp. JCM 24511]|nr:hypothetical protein JCM24511_00535 [Saitozyma sp. JCM 24511]